VDLLQQRADYQPQQRAFTFLQDGEIEAETLTYQELDQRARAIAAHLQVQGLVGERALLLYPPGLDYLAAFFGCLYAGVVAVPAYPPRNARNIPRIQAIVTDAGAATAARRRASFALTSAANLTKLQSLLGQAVTLQWLATDTLKLESAAAWQAPAIDAETLAFLQYTSGSTGTPKGVMLSHGNLLHNAAVTYEFMGHGASSRFVSWLPLYHDMGLIGGILQPLYGGFPCTLMSPVSFLQRPYRWLKAISDNGATTSGGPNFAYELCVQKISPEQRQTLDLSTWQVAFNGAEPIRAETLERFHRTFAACGLRREALYPCYGLAEGTLMVTGSQWSQPPVVQALENAALEQDRAVITTESQENRLLVSSGRCPQDQRIVIVQPDSLNRCQEQEIGEIWVAGPSVGQGYWQRPQETSETFRAYLADTGEGPFLRTGDLGFLHQGELFVTGRLKDLIILRGRNLYPQDLEQTAEASHPALRAGGSAAFTVTAAEEERLVVVQELEFRQKPDLEKVSAAIRRAIAETHEVEVYAVVLIQPGTIPKTSSGKIQRRACREAFCSGQLKVLQESILAAEESAQLGIQLQRAELLAAAPQTRKSLLQDYLQAHIARSLRVDPALVLPQQPLSSLGLDSLRVFDLKNRLEEDLGVEVAIADLFEGVTPEQLGDQILAQLENSQPQAPQPQEQRPAQLPLSFGQEQLFFLEQLQSPAYNIAIAAQLTGSLEVEALEESFQTLVHRHEALRTRFILEGGQPVQVIAPTASLNLTTVDLRSLSPVDQKREIEQLQSNAAAQPFDLGQAPLLRAQLLHLGPEQFRLLLTVHHLVFDGRSAAVFFQELTELYRAKVKGETPALVPLTQHPADWTLWQRRQLQGEAREQLLNYWQQHLAGELPVLQLPCDHPRPSVQTFRGAREPMTLPPAQVAALKDLARQEQATLFMVLLAAFKAWLHRYSGQSDLVVGSPVANRNRAVGLIGFFVNTLALRTDLGDNPSFRSLLRRIRTVALGAYSHAELPFETLVAALKPVRDPSYSPLFQVMFDLQSLPTQLRWPEVDLELSTIETGTAKFDLTLSLIETEAGLQGYWEYNADLFEPQTIRRMSSHFQTLVAGAIADPEQPLSAIPLLSESERQQLLIHWNQTAAALPPACMHELFAAQAEKTPDAIAVRYQDQSLTYEELNQLANQLAHYLQQLGVAAETLVGICAERTPDLLIGLLGILKAGGAYLPLDPTYPPERLAFMLADSQVPILLTQERLLPSLPQHSAKVVCLDRDWPVIQACPIPNPQSIHVAPAGAKIPNPKSLAYVIYTSGSTGKPKGVMIEHRGLVNYLSWCLQAYPLNTGIGAPVHSSISFDMTITGLFSPLLAGQTVELLPEALGIEALATALRHGSTFSLVKITPAQLELLSHQLSAAEAAACTQAFIIGGENLRAEQLNFWREFAPQTQLVNEYGPTETVVGCCVYTVASGDPRSGSVPIGRPIINTQLYILDGQQQPVPIGVVGELYIGGAGVARGYLNRPELTAERFIPDPFCPDPQARLYRTGDLACYRADGVIEFLGRIDHQVKLRGYRIELGEIEAALSQCPGVRESFVLAREDQPGDQRLVAYLVPEGDPPDPAALRAALKQQLPEYMVPTGFVVLEALPLTVNGKVDRGALPAPEPTNQGAAYAAPETGLEQAIADIWQRVLRLERVGRHDNFFDLGGHSLLAVQVHSQLQEALQRPIAMVDLFQYPTVHGLAQYLSQASPEPQQFQQVQEQVSRQKAAFQRRRQLSQQGGRHD